MYSVGEKIGPHQADIEQVAAVVAGGKHVHRNGDALGALAVAEFLGDGGGVLDAAGDGDGDAGLKLVEDLRQVGRVGLVHGEDDGFAEFAGRVALRFLQERFAHDAVAGGREDLPFKILNLEVLLLLVDDHRPAGFVQRLGGDVGAKVKDLRQAEERAFRVFHRVNDVVAEGREAGLAAEIVVGVAELPGFKRFGVLLLRAARR